MPLDELRAKLSAFGMYCLEIDGHNYEAIEAALRLRVAGMPVALIANTTKGKGSSVMENIAAWHHQIPNEEEYLQIKQDLQWALKEV